MAWSVASRGDIPSSMWCSTASTTTIASSTTRPMASTRPKRESVLIEKPRSGKNGEGADERHRHGDHRDQRRAPVLQEEEDDEDDEDHGLDERGRDLADALRDREGGVEGDDVVEVGGEALLELRHRLLDAFGDGERVGAGRLEDGDDAGGLAIQPSDLFVGEAPELDAGDVLQAHDRAVRVRAHDDLAELLRRLEPSLRADRVGHLLAGRRRLGADLAGRVDGALLLDGAVDVRGTVIPSLASRSGLTQIRIA